MPLDSKVGNFDFPAATGNFSVTDVGFQPKLVIFFMADVTAFNTNTVSHYQMFGAIDGTRQSAITAMNTDGVTTSNASRAHYNNKCLARIAGGEVLSFDASFVSFLSNGFTLNVNTAPAAARKVTYLALGGSDISNVRVDTVTTTASSGNQAFTGVGFAPDLVLFVSRGGTGGAINTALQHGIMSWGAATSSSDQWHLGNSSEDAVGGSVADDDRYQRTNRVASSALNSALQWEADFVTMGSDGFTLNFSASPGTTIIEYIALKGAFRKKVGNFNKTTTSGTNVSNAVTGVGFKPDALMLLGYGLVANTTLQTNAAISFGAATAPGGQCIYSRMRDALSTKIGNHIHQNNRIFEQRNVVSFAIENDAELTSFDGDGFTLNWFNSDTTGLEILYLALGSSETTLWWW